jgi:hypothetical protein
MSTPITPQAPADSADKSAQERIILISYPKIVFLWPSFLAALVAGLYMLFADAQPPADAAEMPGQALVSWLFLVVLSINLVVLSFDFPRATSLIIFFVIVAIALGVGLIGMKFPTVLPAVSGWISGIRPMANATFYWFFVTVMGVIYAAVWVNTLHHHGFLSDLERFPAPQLRIDKEINDIFEYLLMGAGRLILHPSNERRAIVLENVLWISGKEKAITRMLGALQVQVRSE